MKCLAIDIGASSGRGIVGEFSDGGLTVSEAHRFANGFVERGGRRVWDLGALVAGVTESIRAAGGDLESLGIDTWGVDYGYVDSAGDLIGDLVAYRDPRVDAAVGVVHGKISPERLYAITGMQHMAINTLFQVADDMAARPEVVRGAERILMMPDLLTFVLTGVPAAEYTITSTSEMLDAASREWSGEVLEAIGFPARLLPEIVMPGESRAPLRGGLARELGVSPEVVRVASHDTASAVAAVPAAGGDDWAYISSGTWSLVGMELASPVLSAAARAKNFTNEGGAQIRAGGGPTIRFLRNVSGLWIIQELRRLWREKGGVELDWAGIVREAESAPAHACFINPDASTFVAPEDMREAVAANALASGQAPPEGVGPTARCVFESLAFAYRRAIDDLAEVTGRRPGRIHVVGGGSQNGLLCRLTAQACGLPVLAGPSEATALGNLLVQAAAAGVIEDVAAGRELVRRSFEPELYEPEGSPGIEGAYERFCGVK